MNDTKTYRYEPDYAVPPGETLLETIEALSMTQAELAVRLKMTPKHINQVIKGKAPISPDMALRLERVTGVPARFWNAREAIYREKLAEIQDGQKLEAELAWLENIPTKELVAREAIVRSPDKTETLKEVLRFFGVNEVGAWRDVWLNRDVAARRSTCFDSLPEATATWLRLGELAAHGVATGPYSKARFLEALKSIRTLSMRPAYEFGPKMRKLCAEAGVALVFVKGLKGVPWYGASWWSQKTPVIELSLRGKKDDQFWFSFFHEAGHILHDSKKARFINDGEDGDERELEANRFAADFLIPRNRTSEVRELRTKLQVATLASELRISPGIVVGRFQRETEKWQVFNDLKKTLLWKEV